MEVGWHLYGDVFLHVFELDSTSVVSSFVVLSKGV